ncbi:MAG: hypothetical protein MK160_14645, partial [Rhodobacteraceae bacterium]|nr:hypothetical protein [Paracoccaceae bacterium]
MRATKTIAQPDLNLVTSQSFPTAAKFKRRSASACVMSVPQSDLTLDMAELYLANLQRDLPFADLGSDGCRIWLGDQTTVSLKMLRRELSELFRLAGQQAPQPPAQRSAILQDGAPEAVLGACAKLNLTGKHDAGELTNWVSGVLAASERDQRRRIQTPGALSALIHALDPLGLPMMAVVWLMQKGWQINPELVNERTRWTVGQVLSLMVTLRCDGLVLSRHIRRAYRTSSRPSVVAARLSLLRCDEAVEASHDTEHLKGVLQRLEAHAPKMLRSVSRRNGFLANPSPERSSSFQRLPEWLPPGLQDNLFLPR